MGDSRHYSKVSWREPAIESALRALWAKGLTGTEIGLRFGVSRGAVLAQARRLTDAAHGRHALGANLPEAERRTSEQYRDKQRGHSRRHDGFNDRWAATSKDEQQANGRLLRNYEPAPLPVWVMATAAFKEAHFATFPPELVERCLAAGCPKGGKVLDPFGGAGTTGLVCDALGIDCDLIELNPDYIITAENRIAKSAGPLLAPLSFSHRDDDLFAGAA